METMKLHLGLTAEDLMHRDGITIPRQMPMREAARLLRLARASVAPVVDEEGKCVGILSAGDLLRWAEEGGSGAAVGPAPVCNYQMRGLVPGSPGEVVCTLAEGSCPLQVMQPTTGGRRIAICQDPSCFTSESQLVAEPVSSGESACLMKTNEATVRLRTPLPELARIMIGTHTHQIVVIDDFGRPAGIVFGTDLLALLSGEGRGETD